MHKVAMQRDVPHGSGLEVDAGGEKILLVRDGAAIRAFAAKCPHAGAPLAAGAVCGNRIVCPWHKAMFRIADGSLLEPPALQGLQRFAVTLEDDVVFVGEAIEPEPRIAPADARVAAIIGSGAAGTACAAALREFGFTGEIVLIGREGAGYDRTALSKFVMSGEQAAGDVSPLLPEDFSGEQLVRRVTAEVERVDAASKRIELADGGTIAFDMALIATGAAPKRPDLPGIDLDGVFTLRDKADAEAIVAGVQAGGRAVILGGSFIGLEVASGLRKRGIAVEVVTPEAEPLAKQIGARASAMLRSLHEQNEVRFHIKAEMVRLEGDRHVSAVVLKDGSALAADLVIVGIGVAPETGFLHGVAHTDDGGVAVDAGMRTTADAVFAAGDVARFPFAGTAGTRIEHWRVAQQHARIAARNMLGGDAVYDDVPFFWTYHFGKRLECFGHPSAWDEEIVDGDLGAQRFVVLLAKAGAVVGVVGCDRERATAVLLDRMRDGLLVDSAKAILAAVTEASAD